MRRWYAWDGRRWVADDGVAVQLAKKTVRAIHHERKQMVTESEFYAEGWETLRRRAEALAQWETRSEGAARITAMLRMAESDPRLSVTAQDFDRDPWVLNLNNGTIDLEFGRFREHRPEELLTKVAGPEYQASAQCPRWEKFLREVFEPHPAMISFIQKAMGYTLTGDTREECVFVLVGSGRNGKSTLIGILDRLLGEYAGLAEMDTFLVTRGSYLREDIADMRGRRLVSAQEPAITGTFAEASLKWTSGGDKLRARRLYEHAQEFQPCHKLWLGMNHLPAIRSDDHATWNRLRVIPFDVCFEHRADRELKIKLLEELSGILRWALKGCIRWQREGLEVPACMANATRLFRNQGDVRSEAAKTQPMRIASRRTLVS